MLVAFSVQNYRSIRECQTMSLLASKSSEMRENVIDVTGVAALEGQSILRSAAVYGANASGKSNFVRALVALTEMVSGSAKESTQTDSLPVTPFRLDSVSSKLPTEFAVTFVISKVLYQYKLAVTQKRVEHEELIAYPKRKPQCLFVRSRDQAGQQHWRFSRTHFRRDKDIETRTRDNSLYVSVCAQFNHKLLTEVQGFFQNIDFRMPDTEEMEQAFTAHICLKNDGFIRWAGKQLDEMDTGIDLLEAEKRDVRSEVPAGAKKVLPVDVPEQLQTQAIVHTVHRIPGTAKTVKWSIANESDGTKQLLTLLRSWYELMRLGRIVVVDELDASLHPLLSRKLVELANNRKTNPKGGQLVFTTHDASLLDPCLLRRDQVFFTERESTGASRLYSLLEYAPRKDEALQKGYLAGRYGAVPFLGGFGFGQDTTT